LFYTQFFTFRLENFEQNLDPDFSVSDFEDDLEDGLRASASSTSTTLISQQALTASSPKVSGGTKVRQQAEIGSSIPIISR